MVSVAPNTSHFGTRLLESTLPHLRAEFPVGPVKPESWLVHLLGPNLDLLAHPQSQLPCDHPPQSTFPINLHCFHCALRSLNLLASI